MERGWINGKKCGKFVQRIVITAYLLENIELHGQFVMTVVLWLKHSLCCYIFHMAEIDYFDPEVSSTFCVKWGGGTKFCLLSSTFYKAPTVHLWKCPKAAVSAFYAHVLPRWWLHPRVVADQFIGKNLQPHSVQKHSASNLPCVRDGTVRTHTRTTRPWTCTVRGNQSMVASYEMLTPLQGKSTLNELAPPALHVSGCANVELTKWPAEWYWTWATARCHYTSPSSREKQSQMPPSVSRRAPASSHCVLLTLFCHHNWGNVVCAFNVQSSLPPF